MDFLELETATERFGDIQQALRPGFLQFTADQGEIIGLFAVDFNWIKANQPCLEAPQRFLQRFLEGPADGHRLADGLHLRGEAIVGGWKLFEGEARNLGDHVVDGRFEGRRRGAPGDLVVQFIEGVANRQLGRDLGDREAGGLRRQRR